MPLPEGSAGIIELREDGVAALTLDPAVAAMGVTLETLAAALARDPARVRAELVERTALPADDKLAQLAQGLLEPGRPPRRARRRPAGAAVPRPLVGRATRAAPS